MGLDIFAASKIKKISEEFNRDFEDLEVEGEVVRVMINDSFVSHDHLTNGIYSYEGESIDFCAGSYGTYGGFRSDLCMLAHKVTPNIIWNNPDIYKGSDFYELINFSDCEGVIGPTTASKLLSDFKKHREEFMIERDVWDGEKYDNWIKALEIASNDGMLIFC
jgi:hypothetical protein